MTTSLLPAAFHLPAVTLLVVCITGVHAQDPEITEKILPEIKLAGLTGRLNCTVINQDTNPVYWIHVEGDMYISKDDKIELDESINLIESGWPKYEVHKYVRGQSTTYQLVIHRLERADAGLYTCQVLYRGDMPNSPSKDGQMVVMVPPSIMVANTDHTTSLMENTSTTLHCDADGYPTPNITWVRVSGAPLPNGKLRVTNKTLHIEQVRPEDRGIYRCLADNAVRPPDFFDVSVLVDFRPVARAVQSSYGQAENRMFDVTIECTVAGWPEPTLHWYRVTAGDNLEEIKDDDKHTINILLNHANILSTHERWFQMVVRSVQANDYGDYVCEGSNKHGSGQGRVNLFATSECQGPNCPEEQAAERNSAVQQLHTTAAVASSLVVLALLLTR